MSTVTYNAKYDNNDFYKYGDWRYRPRRQRSWDLPRRERPVVRICTRCPIYMVIPPDAIIIDEPCHMHSAMDNYDGDIWI